jgi:hypothetical protein
VERMMGFEPTSFCMATSAITVTDASAADESRRGQRSC